MISLTWFALGAGLALIPLPSPAWQRALGLSRRGRLAARAVPSRRRSRSRPPAPQRALGAAGCAAGAALGYAGGGPALAAAAAVAAATAAMLISAALARRHRARQRHELSSAIRLTVAELAAGSRPAAALAAAAEVAPGRAQAFVAASAVAAFGGDVAAVLLGAGGDLEPLGHAWRVAALSGAPVADVLGRLAADLADLEQQQRAVSVALAGPRSSAALLAVLPAVGIALGAAMGAAPLPFLLGTPQGRLLCCVGVLLDAAGVIWTQRLIQRAERP